MLTIDHYTCQKLAGEKWSAAFFLEKFSIIVTHMFSHQSLKWQTVTGKQLQTDTVTHTQSPRLLVNPLLIRPPH